MTEKTKKCPKCDEVMLQIYNTCPACGFCPLKEVEREVEREEVINFEI